MQKPLSRVRDASSSSDANSGTDSRGSRLQARRSALNVVHSSKSHDTQPWPHRPTPQYPHTVRTFTNEPARAGGKVYAVFADLGLVNDVALTTLVAEAAAGAFDAVVREWPRSQNSAPVPRQCNRREASEVLHPQAVRTQ